MSECFALAFLGMILGISLGLLLQFLFNLNGVIYSDFELSGMNLTEPILPFLESNK